LLKILILGGTGFVGRLLTEKLVNSDFDITLFNRGRRNPEIFPGIKKIIGDRNTSEIEKIKNQTWDVVFDFSGMSPVNIELIIDLIKGNVGRYVFISSASAYLPEDLSTVETPITESTETLGCTIEQKKDLDSYKYYGEKKAESDRILLSQSDFDVIIFRPALIYGKYDWSDRFYYWLYRVKKCDKFIIPDNGKTMFTHTYSEDFARILYESINIKKHTNIYNAVTHTPVSLWKLIEISSEILNVNPEVINADIPFLESEQISPWTDLPLWLGDFDMVFDNMKLLKDFLTPLTLFEQSVKETIEYYDALDWYEPKNGLKLEKELELINKLN
jgi:2'-hydroxyisoflavone reductase